MKTPKPYWIRHEQLFAHDLFECSNCRAKTKETSIACPYCGVRMDLRKTKSSPDYIDIIELLEED